jgi:RimJ/RimL family protein N-acetyltransferase
MSFGKRARYLGIRLLAIYRSQGWPGLARFLATRIFQRREDLVYEMRLDDQAVKRLGEAFGSVVVVERRNLHSEATAAVERQILQGENLEYLAGLEGDDLMFAHLDERGQVETYAFALFDTQYKRVLQVPVSTPLIGNCYTQPALRGRGLYPRMLRTACLCLARRGFGSAVISCSPDNIPSIKGIERAGFRRLRHSTTWILLSRIVLARRTQVS